MPPLGVVPDLVSGPHADPLGKRAVLTGLLGEDLLDSKALVGSLGRRKQRE